MDLKTTFLMMGLLIGAVSCGGSGAKSSVDSTELSTDEIYPVIYVIGQGDQTSTGFTLYRNAERGEGVVLGEGDSFTVRAFGNEITQEYVPSFLKTTSHVSYNIGLEGNVAGEEVVISFNRAWQEEPSVSTAFLPDKITIISHSQFDTHLVSKDQVIQITWETNTRSPTEVSLIAFCYSSQASNTTRLTTQLILTTTHERSFQFNFGDLLNDPITSNPEYTENCGAEFSVKNRGVSSLSEKFSGGRMEVMQRDSIQFKFLD